MCQFLLVLCYFSLLHGEPLQSPDGDLPLFQGSFPFSWVPSLFSLLLFRTSSSTYVGFILHIWHLTSKCCHLCLSVPCILWYFSGLCSLWLTLLAAVLILSLLLRWFLFLGFHLFTEFLLLFIPPPSFVSFYLLLCFVEFMFSLFLEIKENLF